MQSEEQRERGKKRMKKNEKGRRKMWDTTNCTNTYLMEVPEREEGKKGAENKQTKNIQRHNG